MIKSINIVLHIIIVFNEFKIEIHQKVRQPNTIYFSTFQKTEEAINTFKNELLWYFKEYQQRLDEVQNG